MLKRVFGIIAVVLVSAVVVMVAITPTKSLCFRSKNASVLPVADTLSTEAVVVECDSVPVRDSIF